MGDPEQQPSPQSTARQRAAQERAAREQLQRMEQALAEMPKVREEGGSQPPEQCRVSEPNRKYGR